MSRANPAVHAKASHSNSRTRNAFMNIVVLHFASHEAPAWYTYTCTSYHMNVRSLTPHLQVCECSSLPKFQLYSTFLTG